MTTPDRLDRRGPAKAHLYRVITIPSTPPLTQYIHATHPAIAALKARKIHAAQHHIPLDTVECEGQPTRDFELRGGGEDEDD